MSLSTRVHSIFRRAWQRYGRPTMSAVPPLSAWSLPAGYTFDASRDGILTGSGAVLNDLDAFEASGYFVGEVIYIVPLQSSDDLRTMVAAGVAPAGSLELYVLSADVATVQEAFAIKLGGLWFNVSSPAVEPSGTGDVWARVRLERRS